MKVNKIYLFDDASEGKKTEEVKNMLNILMVEEFWAKYILDPNSNYFEAYVSNQIYQNGGWSPAPLGANGEDSIICDNDYTENKLNQVLSDSIVSGNTVILIDYYLIDNPTGESNQTALKFLKNNLKDNSIAMRESGVRILFYSAWPNPKMINEIRDIQNPNLYYSKLNYRGELKSIKFDLGEFFRIVEINENEK